MAFDSRMAKALDRIGRLERTVTELALLPQRVARDVQPKIDALIKRQFALGVDPYGRPWRPISAETRKRRKGRKGGPPLTDTRRLRAGTGAKAARYGLRLVLGAPYGYFHQVGTKHMPKRPIFPSRGMPAAWRKLLRDTVREHFRRSVRP